MKGRIFGIAGLVALQTVLAQPVITEHPQNRVAAEGRRVEFSVQAQGTGLGYQWLFNGSELPRANGPSLSFYATQSREGNYSVVVRDSSGSTRNSSAARLEVQKRPRILAQPRRQVVGEHRTAVFEVQVNESAPYSSVQWWHHSPDEPSHPIPPNAARGVNTFRLEIPDANNNGTFNGKYWITIANHVGSARSRRATLTVVGPPRITKQPQDRSVRRGGRASFSVGVAPDAAGSKSLQWYRNGQPIAGATGKTFFVSNAQPDDQSFYHCTVSSVGGSTSSSAARLTVY